MFEVICKSISKVRIENNYIYILFENITLFKLNKSRDVVFKFQFYLPVITATQYNFFQNGEVNHSYSVYFLA